MSGKTASRAEARRTQKRSILFTVDMLEQLEKLASKRHTTTSELVRVFVEKGMTVGGFSDDIDAICDRLSERVYARLSRMFERIIALQVKAALASSMAFTLGGEAIEKLVPPQQRKDFETCFIRAKKEAVAWIRMPEKMLMDSMDNE